jgi:hypothetical protein
MSLLLILVFVHEETHRILVDSNLMHHITLRYATESRQHGWDGMGWDGMIVRSGWVSSILELSGLIRLQQDIYHGYLDWLHFINNISSQGKLQVPSLLLSPLTPIARNGN